VIIDDFDVIDRKTARGGGCGGSHRANKRPYEWLM
jgi:hypothetical protein